MRKGYVKLIALLLAGGILVGCNSNTDKNESTTTTTNQTDIESPGAITPGAAENHLVSNDGIYTLYSPDGTLGITVNTVGEMTYKVFRVRDGVSTEWVRESKLGISVKRKDYFKNCIVTGAEVKQISETFAFLGNQSTIESNCMEAVISLDQGDITGDDGYCLEVRAYNDGVAFRYKLPEMSSINRLEEHTTYSLRGDLSECWYGVNNQDYESVISSYRPTQASNDVITAPLTAVVKNNGGYISIMEGALNGSYPGVNLKAEGKATYSTCFYTTPTVPNGAMVTGWRLINIADDLNGLVNNYNVYSVNEKPGELFADTSWILTGRSAWSWCMTHGAPTPEQMREYTLAAALLGYEYNIIDDGWPAWVNYKQELTSLGMLGESLNVKQLLWGAITVGSDGYNKMPDERTVNAYMRLLEDTHMYGAKVDFWWSEANTNTTALQKYILEEAAKRQYIIDFHGCNKNTGLNITYPNELSREGVRGLENIGQANTTNYSTYASWLNAQLYTRFLCGHADWTPGTYNAMEIASLILIDSPLMVVAAAPEDILASPALELIKSIPTVWDKTVVLSDSEIGKYSAYAKQKDNSWFVGGIASKTLKGAEVDLSEFLPEGTYTAVIWKDTAKGMVSETLTVTNADKIEVGNLSSGQGYAIRISQLSLSSYGGKIGDVEVTAPAGATVKYTTDGSDPATSSTAKALEGGKITLTRSCRLNVAITEGTGKGTKVSHQFNEIDPVYTLTHTIDYKPYETTLEFAHDEGAEIYYTTDGSTPTANSEKVTSALKFTEKCTLRYLIVSENESLEGSIGINVLKPITAPYSDLSLTDASPISAVTDWGNIHYNTSMSTDNGMGARKITLGGTSLNDGTQFDRGISSNANATYVYAVPADYTRFVAVAGIDDCVYNNTAESNKASARIIISFDGVTALTTEVFKRGEYVFIDVEIPEGASQMTIRFDGTSDGITCDNVSLAAPGWVK